MRRTLLPVLTAALLAAAHVQAAVTKPDTLAVLQQRLDKQEQELAEQRRELQRASEDIDKRLSDFATLANMQATHTTWVGTLVAEFGAGMALLGLLGGLITYIGAARKAKDEAKTTAKKWFQSHSNDLQERIRNLEEQADDVSKRITASREKVETEAATATDLIRKKADAVADIQTVTATAQKPNNASEPTRPPPGSADSQLAAAEGQVKGAAVSGIGPLPNEEASLVEVKKLVGSAASFSIAGKLVDEISVYGQIEAKFANETSPAIRFEVARSMFFKGLTLLKLEQPKEALAAFQSVDHRFASDQTEPVLQVVAQALVCQGLALDHTGEYGKALRAFDEVFERFAADTRDSIKEQVATGLLAKSVVLGKMQSPTEQMSVYDDIQSKYGDESALAVRKLVLRALQAKAAMLDGQAKPADALTVYDEILHQFGDDADPDIRLEVLKSLIRRAVVTGKIDHKQEIEQYEALERRYEGDTRASIRGLVARALYYRALTYGTLKEPRAQIAAYEHLLSKFSDLATPEIREYCAKALYFKGFTLAQLGDTSDALQVFDKVIADFGEDTSPAVREQVAGALMQKAFAMSKLKRPSDEVNAYDELLRRFQDDPAFKINVANALYLKTLTLYINGHKDEARATQAEMLTRFAGDSSSEIQDLVNKMKALDLP
jgi:tetratricopeptide (TPR) repeat protein